MSHWIDDLNRDDDERNRKNEVFPSLAEKRWARIVKQLREDIDYAIRTHGNPDIRMEEGHDSQRRPKFRLLAIHPDIVHEVDGVLDVKSRSIIIDPTKRRDLDAKKPLPRPEDSIRLELRLNGHDQIIVEREPGESLTDEQISRLILEPTLRP